MNVAITDAVPSSARDEWRRYWRLPVAAALGYSTSVLPAYGMGAFFNPIQHEFGWSRALTSIGVTMIGAVAAAFSVPLGVLVNHIGPRRVALVGVPCMTAAFALLGSANGQVWNWIALWSVVALACVGLQTTVWTSAITSRFDRSRGFAIAMAVSGASLGASVFPVLATWLISAHGWRRAFMLMAAIWAALVLPAVLLFFRAARDAGPARTEPCNSQHLDDGVRTALRSATLYKLIATSAMIGFTAIGVIVHFVPILTDRGTTPLTAASLAALIGVFSIVGRIGTGLLLDRLPGHFVGAGACCMAVSACLLLSFGSPTVPNQSIAAASFGLTVGSEVDVIAYLASRHFEKRHFGTLFGFINAALALGVALGPVTAGALFDASGSYVNFLLLAGLLLTGSAVMLLSLPRLASARSQL